MTTTPAGSGADLLANELMISLTEGVDFTIPEVDLDDPIYQQPEPGTGPLYEPVKPLDMKEFTTGLVGGTGMFDQLMVSLVAHLKVEYTANRIAGAEYTKAYTGAIQAGLQTAQQIFLAKDQAYWAAILAQQQAQAAEIAKTTARVQLEIAKMQLITAQLEALIGQSTYALAKMKIATEDATYGNAQKQGIALDYTNENLLPAQLHMLEEQIETQRAQTLDTRKDGTVVVGLTGKQKDLYEQQIVAYQRDAETKFAKMYSDAFVSQLTINDGLPVPPQFDQYNTDALMAELRGKLRFETISVPTPPDVVDPPVVV